MAGPGDLLAQLAVQITGDTREFEDALRRSNTLLSGFAGTVNNNLRRSYQDIDVLNTQLSRGFGRLGQSFMDMGRTLSVGVSAPLAGLGVASLVSFGKIEALQKGLAAVMGGAEAAGKEFKNLKETAKLPGLGLPEVVKGSINLQTIGFSAEKARESIQVFGNAVATVGKGRVEFERAIYGLQQLANTDFPLGEDLNIIKDAIPQVTPLLKEAFGTARTEDLKKLGISSKQVVETIIAGLAKLPKVAGGFNNSLENIRDTATTSLAKIGESINKNFNIEEKINKAGVGIELLADKFAELEPSTQASITGLAALAVATGPVLFGVGAMVKAIPTLITGLKALGLAGVDAGLKLRNGLALGGIAVLLAGAAYQFGEYTDLINQNTKFAENAAVEYFSKYSRLSKEAQNQERSRLTELFEYYANNKKLAEDNIALAAKRIQVLKNGQDPTFKTRDERGTQIASQTKLVKAFTDQSTEAERALNNIKEKLKLIDQAAADTAKTTDGLKITPVVDDKIAKAIAEINKQLADAATKAVIFGEGYDLLSEKANILEKGIGNLVELGLKPQNKYIKEFKDQLDSIDAGKILKAFDQQSAIPIVQPISFKSTQSADEILDFSRVALGSQIFKEYSEAVAKAAIEGEVFGRVVDKTDPKLRKQGNALDTLDEQIGLTEQAIQKLIPVYGAQSVEVQNLIKLLGELKAEYNNVERSTIDLSGALSSGITNAISSFAEEVGGAIGKGSIKNELSEISVAISDTESKIKDATAVYGAQSDEVKNLKGNLSELKNQYEQTEQSATGFGKVALKTVGAFLSQLGQAAVAAGVASLALKASIANPYAAIAAGAAAIVAGAALSAAASKVSTNRNYSSSSSGGLSTIKKSDSSTSPSQQVQSQISREVFIYVEGKLTADGNALVGLIEKQIAKDKKVGG